MPRRRVRAFAVVMVVAVVVLSVPLPAVALIGTPYPVQQTGAVWRPDGVSGDQYGYAVAIDGNTAVVGAPYENGGEGSAFVYEFNGAGWVFSQEIPADPAAGDHFGAAVDIDGDHIVVGAPEDSVSGTARGSAVVFQRTPTGWTYLSELVPTSAAAGDKFGFAVSISGTTAVVGAPRDDTLAADSGAIYIFKEGSPTLKRTMAAAEAGAEFGRSVDVYGNYMVAGAPFEDNIGGTNAGSALMYYGDGVTVWTATGYVYAHDPQIQAGFGYAVATTGGTTAVGAYTYDVGVLGGAGAVDVLTRSGSGLTATWPWSQTLTDSAPAANQFFGEKVAMNGSVLAVGAPWDDGNLGSVHVYEAGPAGWTFTQKLGVAGWFGSGVGVSHEGRIAVGAMTGDGAAPDTGVAYFYARLNPVYRFYNAGSGTHFFTGSTGERDHVIATWPTIFTYEGIAYSVNPYNNKSSLFRFYKPSSSSHFYTASEEERDHVIATWPTIYQYDGPAYDVSTSAEPGKLPVYRFYNLRNGSHFYTADTAERDRVIGTLGYVYQYEGPAFWLGQ